MGLKFSSLAIRGIDVSQFNGNIDWTKVSCHFASIRVGYGRVIESKFLANWQNAKGKVNRIPYWYLDYYSNYNADSGVNGTSDAEWGKVQADTCWNSFKNDPEGIVFLDIENGNTSYAPPIATVASRVQAIARAFLERIDALNGKVNGVYCSLGLLNWFGIWFKVRPLWVAWYNEEQTFQTVLTAVKNAGWTGKCYIWQYASDGDVDDDGIADGIKMGMQYDFLDLNAWLGNSQEYTAFFGKEVAVELYKVKILIYNLLVRSGPGTLYLRLRRADFPGEYNIYEEKNGFGRISTLKAEWISLNPEYVQKLTTTTVLSDAEKLLRLWAAHPELH
ncbi:MAG: GH25 family lysozyme [Chloroflexi bacterium]|nr:GH25 family lysozyme [Chloroflexota bacterium]